MPRFTADPNDPDEVRPTEEVALQYDGRGDLLGPVSPPLSRDEIDAIQRRLASTGPWYRTDEVLEHLRARGQEREPA